MSWFSDDYSTILCLDYDGYCLAVGTLLYEGQYIGITYTGYIEPQLLSSEYPDYEFIIYGMNRLPDYGLNAHYGFGSFFYSYWRDWDFPTKP